MNAAEILAIHRARSNTSDPTECGRLYSQLPESERALLGKHDLAMWQASTHLRPGNSMSASELAKACSWGIGKARTTLAAMLHVGSVSQVGRARYEWVPTTYDLRVRASF